MVHNRRDFMKSLGIALASMLIVRCSPAGSSADSVRDRLRNCWLKFDWLTQQAQGDIDQSEKARQDLINDHRTALSELVSNGELKTEVADQLQVAFEAAAYHVWRANAPITCYEPSFGPDYNPTSSDQLAKQVDLLNEITRQSDLDPATLAQAQSAIERDITFLNIPDDDLEALYDELIKASGDTWNYPSFDELELKISPQAVEAAQFLVELLLANSDSTH
jgi:hypothetical protein